MGIASMVIGIVAAVVCFVPFCNYYAIIPAVVGLVLGIVDVVMKSQNKEPNGMGIAGIVLNVLALIIILVYTLIISQIVREGMNLVGNLATNEEAQKALSNLVGTLTNENTLKELSNMVESIERLVSNTK